MNKIPAPLFEFAFYTIPSRLSFRSAHYICDHLLLLNKDKCAPPRALNMRATCADRPADPEQIVGVLYVPRGLSLAVYIIVLYLPS